MNQPVISMYMDNEIGFSVGFDVCVWVEQDFDHNAFCIYATDDGGSTVLKAPMGERHEVMFDAFRVARSMAQRIVNGESFEAVTHSMIPSTQEE